jgi:DNA helicase-2/ATP-dependent DNA helicase PcrA
MQEMNFENLYKSLNQNQQNAVDSIEGCVMVVAGPGTGKTQVLGARVASILKHTDTNPENILCLTFTEAAATALRNRLYQFIGSGSHRVNILTYHGFSNHIIQENKDIFGVQDLNPISDLEVIEVLKSIIDELPNNSTLKRFRGEVYFDLKNLKKLFSLLKKDGLSPNDIEMMVENHLKGLKESEAYYYKRKTGNFNKGDFKIRAYQEEEDSLKKLVEASHLLSVYEQKLANIKRYDFDDMLSWVLDVFREHPEVLLNYQETYQYVLVDEYQDTNGIQNKLLYKLIEYWENPNVFVVGDDDQSIYKFQGANVENIYQFYKHYEKYVKLIVLDENYRSSQSILDGSNSLITKNEERLVGRVPGLTKEIKASNPAVATIPQALKIVEYPNSFQEIVSITHKIKKLHQGGIELKNVAVLYRTHSQSEELVRFLQSEGLDYNVVKTQNVLEVPIIIQLQNFLQYLNLESKKLDSGQHLLFEILHSNNFKFLSAFDISRISNFCYSKRKDGGWRSLLNTVHEQIPISNEAKIELKQFVADCEYWLKEMHNLTLQVLVEKVMSKMGFVARALASSEATFKMQCLKTFFNFLKAETSRNPQLKLESFLNKIDLLEKNKLGLNLNKIVHGVNGINLMTVHGSKGLEFDYVFLLGCTENKWEKERTSLPFKLNNIIAGEPKTASEEEARRLFYVALTRAKKGIEVSYAIKNEKDKDTAKSVYVVELEESGAAISSSENAQEDEMLHFFDFMIQHQDDQFVDLINQDFVIALLEDYRLNATNLNNYLKCPVTFFYQNIIRVPSAKGESMSFGSAIHYALEGLFKQNDLISNAYDAKNLLSSRFNKYIHNNRESFTKEALERRLHYGNEVLSDYYDNYCQKWNLDLKTESEVYFNHSEIEGVPISGVIDKLELDGNVVNVVDYKTGKYEYGRKKIGPPVSLDLDSNEENYEKRNGGDYWRQVLFYKALIESDKRYNYNVISGEIDFIEPHNGAFIKSKIMIKEDEYAYVKEQIKKVYKQIMNREFSEGCNEADCQWCNFNRYYLGKNKFSSKDLLSNSSVEIEER